jgi:hypothetical protein
MEALSEYLMPSASSYLATAASKSSDALRNNHPARAPTESKQNDIHASVR